MNLLFSILKFITDDLWHVFQPINHHKNPSRFLMLIYSIIEETKIDSELRFVTMYIKKIKWISVLKKKKKQTKNIVLI